LLIINGAEQTNQLIKNNNDVFHLTHRVISSNFRKGYVIIFPDIYLMESTERSFTEDNNNNNSKKTSSNNEKESGFECNVSCCYCFRSIK
jgi:hypothetical protein